MRSLFLSLAVLSSSGAFAASSIEVFDREFPINLLGGAGKVEALANGSFAALLSDASGPSRVYFLSPSGAVTALKAFPPSVSLYRMVVEGDSVYCVGWMGSGAATNAYLVKLDANGAVLWSRSVDSSSTLEEDLGSDLALAANGRVYACTDIRGNNSRGGLIALNKGTGAIELRLARKDIRYMDMIAIIPSNGNVFLSGIGSNSLLSANGAKIATNASPAYNRVIAARGDVLYVAGEFDASRSFPYIARLSTTNGSVLWSQTDPAATGMTGTMDRYKISKSMALATPS